MLRYDRAGRHLQRGLQNQGCFTVLVIGNSLVMQAKSVTVIKFAGGAVCGANFQSEHAASLRCSPGLRGVEQSLGYALAP